MRIVSWNVNGIRAAMKKDFESSLSAMQTDILCIQETKAQDDQVREALAGIDGYRAYANSAVKKGYAGTAILTRREPAAVRLDMGIASHDQEGRVIALDFKDFYLVTVYTPNSGSELKRLEYRQGWDADFLAYLKKLETKKPVIACGDFNVAHQAMDLARPKPNYNKTAGYMQLEIDGMDNMLAADFVDAWRYLYPDRVKYSWWSYRAAARKRNIGWRIDYFIVSQGLAGAIDKVDMLNDIMGSDHCPVLLDVDIHWPVS
ncbi:MAG: exodeoxyribonuclease III [Deltaproteobacteria bacterium]|nr:exodeoxyribonuclease III [Deltaproteobacteria bacterium]MBW2633680.1 exodeoxyribonuclease III [Deltaproteobacteria bacterium]MBW2678394.1 exodeoxyribonuclease III [Deltaproteobacteria bacterium]